MIEQELIDFYRIDFKEKTGKKLLIYIINANVGFLEPLLEIVNSFIPYGIKTNNKTVINIKDVARSVNKIIFLKRTYCTIASIKGYSHEAISEAINLDRSTVSWHIKKAYDALSEKTRDPEFKEIYDDVVKKVNEYERNI